MTKKQVLLTVVLTMVIGVCALAVRMVERDRVVAANIDSAEVSRISPNVRFGSSGLMHNIDSQSMVFSADNGSLFSGGVEGELRKWNVRTWELEWSAPLHETSVTSIDRSSDGRLVVSGSGDGFVCVCDSRNGNVVWARQMLDSSVRSVAFSKDATKILISGKYGDVMLIDSWSGRKNLLCSDLTDVHSPACFAQDGIAVHNASGGGVTICGDKGRRVIDQGDPGVQFDRMIGSPSGKKILRYHSSGHGLMSVWDIALAKGRSLVVKAMKWFNEIVFSMDGERILVSDGKKLKVVSLREADFGVSLVELNDPAGDIRAVAISADGKLMATAGTHGLIKLFNADDGAEITQKIERFPFALSVAVSAESRFVAAGGIDGDVNLWDISKTTIAKSFKTFRGELAGFLPSSVKKIIVSKDNQLLVALRSDGMVFVFSVSEQSLKSSFHAGDSVDDIGFDFSEMTISASSRNHVVETFSANTGKLISKWDYSGRFVGFCSANGFQQTVTIEDSPESDILVLRSVPDGQIVKQIKMSGDRGAARIYNKVHLSKVTEDGNYLIISCGNLDADTSSVVKVFDLKTGKETRSLKTAKEICCLSICSDGSVAALGSRRGVVVIWDVISGSILKQVQTDQWSIRALCFSSDAKWLFSSGINSNLQGWRVGGD